MAFHGQGYHWAVRSWHILFIFIPCLATAAGYWITWFEHYDLSDEVEVFPQNPGEHSQNEVNQHEATILRYSPTFTYVISWVLSCLSRRVFPHHCEARADELEKTLQKERAEHKVPGWTLRQQRVWVMGYQGFSKGISPLNSDGNGLPVVHVFKWMVPGYLFSNKPRRYIHIPLYPHSTTMWGPPVVSWFIHPINYSYRHHKP